jgi:hypothetical protein
MDLSIVVPAYNEERRLQPTLDGWAAGFGFAGLFAPGGIFSQYVMMV